MRTLANIIWHFPFFGFLQAGFVALLGLLFCATIIGLPIGLGLIQYANFLLGPFSREMVTKKDIGKQTHPLLRFIEILIFIIWVPIGLCLVLVTFIEIIALCLSIIGIPVAIILAKSLGTYFNPIGKVSVAVKRDN